MKLQVIHIDGSIIRFEFLNSLLTQQNVSEETEREHIRKAIKSIEEAVGRKPVGWYTGNILVTAVSDSNPGRIGENSVRLAAQEGEFLYFSDSYADDLPYWEVIESKPQLIIPYTLETNDMKFSVPPGSRSYDFTDGKVSPLEMVSFNI